MCHVVKLGNNLVMAAQNLLNQVNNDGSHTTRHPGSDCTLTAYADRFPMELQYVLLCYVRHSGVLLVSENCKWNVNR